LRTRRSSYGETLFANQYFQLRNGVQANKHVFAGGQRVATVLSHFNAGNWRPGGPGGGGGGGGGHGGTSPGHGGEPPGHGGEPPSRTGRDGTGGEEPPEGGDTGDDAFWPGDPGDAPPPTVAGHPFYFHADHLGSTTVLTDPQGDVHEHLQYFPDGELWIERGPRRPINGHRFSGKFFDPETGFYDFEQRFYDPKTSLWLSVDPAVTAPAAMSIRDSRMLSVYSHSFNNPIAFRDPDGRVTYRGKSNSAPGATSTAVEDGAGPLPWLASGSPASAPGPALQLHPETAATRARQVARPPRRTTRWKARHRIFAI
jgi:RHS repeat-associated protein